MKDLARIYLGLLNSVEVLDKLKAGDFDAPSMSTYDFPLFTLLYLILIGVIERIFQREGSPHLTCNNRNMFFFSLLNSQKMTYMVLSKCM